MRVHCCARTYTLLLTSPYKLTLTTVALRRPCVLTSPYALAYGASAGLRVALPPPPPSRALLPRGSRGHPKRPLLTLAGGPTRTALAADSNGSTAAVRERAAAPAVTVAGIARIASPRTARIASRFSPAPHTLAFISQGAKP